MAGWCLTTYYESPGIHINSENDEGETSPIEAFEYGVRDTQNQTINKTIRSTKTMSGLFYVSYTMMLFQFSQPESSIPHP